MLRVAGLGHAITLETEASTTIASLKQEIERHTKIPVMYQRLLARGKKLETDNQSIKEAGIEDRTKVMLLHNATYAQEKDGYEVLARLGQEIDDLESKKHSTTHHVISELVTRICCKLDAVEINGSENLRALRKKLIRKAEGIDSQK